MIPPPPPRRRPYSYAPAAIDAAPERPSAMGPDRVGIVSRGIER